MRAKAKAAKESYGLHFKQGRTSDLPSLDARPIRTPSQWRAMSDFFGSIGKSGAVVTHQPPDARQFEDTRLNQNARKRHELLRAHGYDSMDDLRGLIQRDQSAMTRWPQLQELRKALATLPGLRAVFSRDEGNRITFVVIINDGDWDAGEQAAQAWVEFRQRYASVAVDFDLRLFTPDVLRFYDEGYDRIR